MSKQEYIVPDELDGARLDKALAQVANNLSRARVRRAIEEGAVRLNGRRKPKGAVVAKGDVLSILDSHVGEEGERAVAEDGPLVVRFESPSVLVVDKPAGQPSAPLRPGETGTLANVLLARYPELASIGYNPREPGLVHRLDTNTSGLLVVARTNEAFEELKAALKNEEIEKTYWLLCKESGLPDSGAIEFPIANHPKDQKRVYPCIHPRDVIRYAPRPAKTEYQVLERRPPLALVEVRVSRAVRHQIRAHMAALGHPLAGDVLYGGEAVAGLERHALHAAQVAFEGAAHVSPFNVKSELPADLRAVWG